MSSTPPSPRPARQRKISAKAQEMLDLDEYVNSESEIVESDMEDASMQDSENDMEEECCVDDCHAKGSQSLRKPTAVKVSEDESNGSDDEEVFSSSKQEKKDKSDAEESPVAKKERNQDLAEVIITTDSPKKEKKSTVSTPLGSPLKKMSIGAPKTPESPLKRKRISQRAATPDSSEADNPIDSEEEMSRDEKSSVTLKSKLATKASPKKSRTHRHSLLPTPRKSVKAPATPKSLKTDKTETPAKSPSKVNVTKSKCDNLVTKEEERHDDSDKRGTARKPPCTWTEEEADHIGQVYMQAINALAPSAFKVGLDKIWDEDEDLKKTNKDIQSHLRKWKKVYQTATSSMTDL